MAKPGAKKIDAATSQEAERHDGSANLQSYHEYNKVLRTWFVAFGVAGPSLFVVNDQLAKKLSSAGALEFISFLFLGGVTFQIFVALVNKFANWHTYLRCIDKDLGYGWQYQLSDWLLRRIWIDIIADCLTILCFMWAAWTMFIVLS